MIRYYPSVARQCGDDLDCGNHLVSRYATIDKAQDVSSSTNEAVNLLTLGKPTVTRALPLIDTVETEGKFVAYQNS